MPEVSGFETDKSRNESTHNTLSMHSNLTLGGSLANCKAKRPRPNQPSAATTCNLLIDTDSWLEVVAASLRLDKICTKICCQFVYNQLHQIAFSSSTIIVSPGFVSDKAQLTMSISLGPISLTR